MSGPSLRQVRANVRGGALIDLDGDAATGLLAGDSELVNGFTVGTQAEFIFRRSDPDAIRHILLIGYRYRQSSIPGLDRAALLASLGLDPNQTIALEDFIASDAPEAVRDLLDGSATEVRIADLLGLNTGKNLDGKNSSHHLELGWTLSIPGLEWGRMSLDPLMGVVIALGATTKERPRTDGSMASRTNFTPAMGVLGGAELRIDWQLFHVAVDATVRADFGAMLHVMLEGSLHAGVRW